MNRQQEPGRGEGVGVGAAPDGITARGPQASDDPVAGGGPAPIELETPTHRGDVTAASACLAAGLAGYFLVVPAAVYVPSRFAGSVNSPAFLPNALFLILTVLGAVYLAVSVARWRHAAAQGRARGSDWALAAGTALICTGYVAAIYLLGMTLASACSVAATMFYFGERRPAVIVPIAVILPAMLWYFFVEIAHIPLPPPLLDYSEWLSSTPTAPAAATFARLVAPIAS